MQSSLITHTHTHVCTRRHTSVVIFTFFLGCGFLGWWCIIYELSKNTKHGLYRISEYTFIFTPFRTLCCQCCQSEPLMLWGEKAYGITTVRVLSWVESRLTTPQELVGELHGSWRCLVLYLPEKRKWLLWAEREECEAMRPSPELGLGQKHYSMWERQSFEPLNQLQAALIQTLADGAE